MPRKKSASTHPVQVGDTVRIRTESPFAIVGRILAIHEPIAPGYDRIIRVKMRGKPNPAYTEVLEEQVELVQAKSAPDETP